MSERELIEVEKGYPWTAGWERDLAAPLADGDLWRVYLIGPGDIRLSMTGLTQPQAERIYESLRRIAWQLMEDP